MSNERIDLTQFEGHTEGPWYYEMPPEEGMVIKVSDFCHVAELSFLMSNMSPYTDDVNPTGLDPDAVDARLILAAPDLLAELKRCYEEIDSLQGKINKANYAMQRYCDEWPDLPYPDHRIDNVCDAYEEVCLALE